MVQRLHRFHDHRDGQISMLTVFGAVALAGLLGLVMTTGDQVGQKIQMQNSVDAAALSGGAWIARGLNVTSAFNLMQTQLAGGAILLRGLDNTLPLLYPVIIRNIFGWALCVPYNPFCTFMVEVNVLQLELLPGVQRVIGSLTRLLARCPTGLFWLAAKGLEYVNAFVHYTFVFIANAEAHDVARASGARLALLVPGPIFNGNLKLTMPTRKQAFWRHCDPMENGSRRRLHRGYHPLIGYHIGDGPYRVGRDRLRWIVRAVGGVPWWTSVRIYDALTRLEKNAICYGGRCGSIRPDPYLLDTADDGLSFLAIAYRPNREIFFTGPRVEESPDFYTYAQVEIYNGVNGPTPDAYTQDWRVRLAPASLIERPFEIFGQTTVGSALAEFATFALIFLGADEVTVSEYLWQVGNH